MATPVVQISGAVKTFDDGTRALDGVSLSLAPGEFVSLIGPSGCGKSTLLRLVAGLSSPTEGALQWWGEPDRLSRSRDIVFVFQSPTLLPWCRVQENVRLPLDLQGIPRTQAGPKVDAALALVGLEGFERHYPRQLSGGMQMRVSIARALVTEPRLLLMDEPFGALDEITRHRLDDQLMRLYSTRGFSSLFVTHSIYEAVFLSTRVVVMSARPGRIAGEVVVDEPFPREPSFRTSEIFAHRCAEVTRLLADAHAFDRVAN